MGEHAKRILQPSQFRRTVNCPGWGNLCETRCIPPRPSGPYADEGTLAHDIAACCLARRHDAEKFLGKRGYINANGVAVYEDPGNARYATTIDENLVDAVQVYLDTVRKTATNLVNPVIGIEQRLNMSWLVPGMFGTADCILVEYLGVAHVIDYKHGQGVPVDVGKNVGDSYQLGLYGVGAIGEGNPYGIEEVEVTIVQPRAPHSDGPVRSIRFDVEDLIEWARQEVVPAAKFAQNPNAPVIAGPWCRWCDAEGIVDDNAELACPAHAKEKREELELMFDKKDVIEITSPVKPVDPSKIPGKKIDRILELAIVIETWLDAVRVEARKRLETGAANAPKAWKLVAGNLSNRKWGKAENEVYEAVQDYLSAREASEPAAIKSVAQMEKALKKCKLTKKEIDEIINPLLAPRTEGNPSMVPVSDKRPALGPAFEKKED